MSLTRSQLIGLRSRVGTQAEVGALMGVRQVTIARWETLGFPKFYRPALVGLLAERGFLRCDRIPRNAIEDAGGLRAFRKQIGSLTSSKRNGVGLARILGIQPQTGYKRELGRKVRGVEWYRLAIIGLAVESGLLGACRPTLVELAEACDGMRFRTAYGKTWREDADGRRVLI